MCWISVGPGAVHGPHAGLDLIKDRIEAALVFESSVLKTGVRKEALRPLHYLFLSGEEILAGKFKPCWAWATV